MNSPRRKESAKRSVIRRRFEVLSHYSKGAPKCKCCGEDKLPFLTIDHVNDDGKSHRKEVPTSKFYAWLRMNSFPKGYRVLCFNCNTGRALNGGICPHKKYKEPDFELRGKPFFEHNDEFTDMDISPYRKVILRRKRDGLCARCNTPSNGYYLCATHREKHNNRERRRVNK